MRIVITGAHGRVGRQMVDELDGDHALVLVDRRRRKGVHAVRADISRSPGGNTRRRRWRRYDWSHVMQGADAVLHLAGNPSPRASWDAAMTDNAGGTWNVLEAACRHAVPRVVIASSNHVIRAAIEEAAKRPHAEVDHPTGYRPLNPYGISKATAELVGRMFIERGLLKTFVAVRIGGMIANRPSDPVPCRLTIDAADLRTLLRRCLEAPIEGYHMVYGVSPDSSPIVDMTSTMRTLSWRPPWWSLKVG